MLFSEKSCVFKGLRQVAAALPRRGEGVWNNGGLVKTLRSVLLALGLCLPAITVEAAEPASAPTTDATVSLLEPVEGQCDACHEAAVRFFCTNHTQGLWLEGSACFQCGARHRRGL